MPDHSRPNILFAIADDASHCSAFGHTFVNTPHFDRVARQGILFTNAFTTNPKCAPSRASILTGRHTRQNRESCLHWNYWPNDLPVYPDVLEKAGYHIGFTGKGWAPGDWKRCGRTRNPAGVHYNTRKLTPPEGSKISNNDYAANFDDFLAARPNGAPFCFWYGGHEPHRHYTPGEGLRHGKKMADVTEVPPYWPQEDVIRDDMLDYAFETEWFDAQLGKMLAKLGQMGELDNTLVVVTSDNGAPFPRVKGQMFDDDFRLPFAAMWPQRIQPGRKVDDLISFTDIAPTFLEAAGALETVGTDFANTIPGRSLFDIFKAKLHDTDDPRVFGNGDIFESYEYIVDAPHSGAHYLKGDWEPQRY